MGFHTSTDHPPITGGLVEAMLPVHRVRRRGHGVDSSQAGIRVRGEIAARRVGLDRALRMLSMPNATGRRCLPPIRKHIVRMGVA
jgi:predicted NAD/FAD-binding protein